MKKKTKEFIAVLIVAALLTPAIIYALPFVVNGYYSSLIMSGSMEPTIPVSSIVVVETVNPKDVKVNDIIVFQRSDLKTLHRVIDKIEENNTYYFQTKGDANENPDPWTVKPDQIQGSLMLTIPYYGYFFHFAGTPIGFLLMVLIPAIILITSELRKIIELTKEEKTSNTKT